MNYLPNKIFVFKLALQFLALAVVDVRFIPQPARCLNFFLTRPVHHESHCETAENLGKHKIVKFWDKILKSSNAFARVYSRLMPFRPLFPCVPWSRGTNNIALK